MAHAANLDLILMRSLQPLYSLGPHHLNSALPRSLYSYEIVFILFPKNSEGRG